MWTSLSVWLWPMVLGGLGVLAYKTRDAIMAAFVTSLEIQESGPFMDAVMDVLRKAVWAPRWVTGTQSMYRKESDQLLHRNTEDMLGLQPGWYLARLPCGLCGVTVAVVGKTLHDINNSQYPAVTISVWRWQRARLFSLLHTFKAAERSADEFFSAQGGMCSWRFYGRPRTGFQSLFLPAGMSEELQELVSWFVSVEGRHWYRSMGQAYKLVILLHGPPGTGKTATARAIADVTNRTLVTLPLLLGSQPARAPDMFARQGGGGGPDLRWELYRSNCKVALLDELDKAFLACEGTPNVSELLSVLDGAYADGMILVLTANDLTAIPEPLRASLLRPRRIDRCYEVGLPTAEQKAQACAHFKVVCDDEILAQASMADVMGLIMDRRSCKRRDVRCREQPAEIRLRIVHDDCRI